MNDRDKISDAKPMARFNRRFFDSEEDFTRIGPGEIGGKAQGLAAIKSILESHFGPDSFPGFTVSIPRLTVISTTMFERFMERNNLYEKAYSDARDDHIAYAFQKAELPAELVGDLRALVNQVHTPLAIRSSSLLEDAMHEPFAGVYGTKMVPNNQHVADNRFHVLVEAVKFVYASTFFRNAKNYLMATGRRIEEEKMAVIIQEVVGLRHANRFYPHISGVARSYNFYATGHARPEDGVACLALGLGKTIVDGGLAWPYSPAFPSANPPYGTLRELMKQTQTDFWTVNMGKPPAYDPIRETEYLCQGDLVHAEKDKVLKYLASTYNQGSDKITLGTGSEGPRLLNFAPILQMNDIPLNKLVKALLKVCEETFKSPVEIEFAVTLDKERGLPARFGFLQVRPMFVSDAKVDVHASDLESARALAASESVLGNGVVDTLHDVIYVKPETFSAKDTSLIGEELDQLNRHLLDEGRHYLLIVFGRLGSADSWLGIPVEWGQVAGARVIVEASLPQMNVDLSQGSHFFHNVTSLQVCYFSMDKTGKYPIRWDWLEKQETVEETRFVKHVQLASPLLIKVDGRNGRGVILT